MNKFFKIFSGKKYFTIFLKLATGIYMATSSDNYVPYLLQLHYIGVIDNAALAAGLQGLEPNRPPTLNLRPVPVSRQHRERPVPAPRQQREMPYPASCLVPKIYRCRIGK